MSIDTLKYVLNKYDIRLAKRQSMPIEIPNTGRHTMAQLFAELGFTRGVEVGVLEGAFSELLCKTIPDLHLWSVDPWLEYPACPHWSQAHLDQYEATARERLARFNCDILKMTSVEAVNLFGNESIDFVYIDGNHDFWNCAHDIQEWGKRIRKGGIISGHDYALQPLRRDIQVKYVVHAYTRAYQISPWFVWGHHAKVKGVVRDQIRSWMWVKN